MSEVGEDVYTSRPSGSGRGLKSTAERDETFVAASRPKHDPRKFPFDVRSVGVVSPKSWSATKADRMSPVEAGSKLADLMRMFKIDRQGEDFCAGFYQSLLFCMAVNSSSVLTPDRATFDVSGTEFQFLSVVKYLNSDLRRFFRAYADDTVMILKQVLDHPDQLDDFIRDKKDLIMSVARDRNLVRFPYLIGDNAEACSSLAEVEHVAIAGAKQSKLESAINVADRLNTRANPKTHGAFDSTNGEFLDK